MKIGFIGGYIGYTLLKNFGRHATAPDYQNATSYDGISKLEVLLGKNVWKEVKDKVVVDYGCGSGNEVVEIAQHGAKRVIGIDTWDKALRNAKLNAVKAGVAGICEFTDGGQSAIFLPQISSFPWMLSSTTTNLTQS